MIAMPTHHEHTQSPHDTTQCLKQAMLWLSTLPWDVTIEVSGRTIVWTWQLTNVDELKIPKETPK